MRILSHILLFLPLSVFAQTSGQTPSIAEEQDYAFAYGLYSDGLYQIAGEQFDVFLQKYPSSVRKADAYFLSIECRFQLQQFDTAARLFARFVREYPSGRLTDDAYLRLGEALLRLNRPADAIASFKTILDRFGTSELAGEAAYWIGESFVRTGEYENAVKYYSLAYEHYPNNRLRDYALYGIGWTYQTKQEYEKALGWYERLRKEFPQSDLVSASVVRTGECHFYAGNYRKAIQELTTAGPTITRDDERGEAQYLIAEAHFHLNDFANALRQYESFLGSFPGHRLARDVLYALGWTHLKMNNFTAAAETFDRLAGGNDPLAHAGLFRRGVAEKFGNKRERALATWAETVRRTPAGDFSDNALYESGLVLYEDGKRADARGFFERVVASYPRSDVLADAQRMMGECLVAEGKYREAGDAFAKALEIEGASFDVRTNALFQLGWTRVRLKQYPEAVESFSQFLDAFPDHPKASEARFWRAEARYQLGQYEAALDDYETVARQRNSAKREESLYGAGWSLYKLNQFARAIVRFEELIREFPSTKLLFDARLRLADSYYFAKDYSSAESGYRAVIRQFPDHEGLDYAQYQLGQAAYRLGKYNDAVRQFQLLIKEYPVSDLADDAQYALGWIWFQNKEYPEAIKEFQRVLDLFPQSELAARAVYSIGDAKYNQQDYPGAERAYRQVLQQYSRSPYVGDAVTGIQYCLLAQGKPDEALKVIDTFVRDHPQSPMVETLLLKKGDLLFSQQQYDAAIREYRSFAGQRPQSPQVSTAYYWIGRSYLAQERPLDAASAFEHAANVPHGLPSMAGQAALEASDIYRKLKSYDKALAVLSAADRAEKGSTVLPEAMVRRGAIHEARGDLASALQEYNAVISAYGRTTAGDRARVALARLYMKETNFQDAHRLASDVAGSRTDELGAEAQYVIGLIFSAQRDWSNAVTAFLKVRYVFPSHEVWLAQAYLGLGAAYEALNDPVKAREAYRNVLRLDRQQEAVTEAQKRLRNLERS